MAVVVLGFRIEDRSCFRGLTKRLPQLMKQLLVETAEKHHDDIFPKHFGPQNRSEYQYEARRPLYEQVIKKIKGEGVGKYRDDVLTGKAQRFMKVFFKITGSSKHVACRLTPPPYFANPFIGSFTVEKTDKQGRTTTATKRITRQPDKPNEVTRVSDADRAVLQGFMGERIIGLINDNLPAPRIIEAK